MADSLNVQDLFSPAAISGSRVMPTSPTKFSPAKSVNFRAAQMPGGLTPAFTGGFSFKQSTKRSAATYSMSSENESKSVEKNSALDDMIKDAYPEAEIEEILEEQRKVEVKNKALEKIKFEKELAEELEKQKKLKAKEAAELDDVDGFHLFKEQMDLPYKEDHPNHKIDIEDKVEEEKQKEASLDEDDVSETVAEETTAEVSEETEEVSPPQELEIPQEIIDEVNASMDEDDPEYDDEEDDDDEPDEEEQMKIWTIVYSKKPELIIDKDEYDRILVDLL